MKTIFLMMAILIGGVIGGVVIGVPPTPVPLCIDATGTITHCTEMAKPRQKKRQDSGSFENYGKRPSGS